MRFHIRLRFFVRQNLLCILTPLILLAAEDRNWIRINQCGYLPGNTKVAVLVSTNAVECNEFSLHSAISGMEIWRGDRVSSFSSYGPFQSGFRLDFSDFDSSGIYFLRAADTQSPVFPIDQNVYHGISDFILRYMRQQRCGFNPFLNDSCHTSDGFTIYGPMPDGTKIDAVGGWHDASDYLQYVTTSANATYLLLRAYEDNPSVFGDRYLANGLDGANGVADVFDEAVWGLEWLLKMHPRSDWMFNQIADDRDHRGFRLPTQDTVGYGNGFQRPVYFCSGKPQGLFEYKNRTTGTASTAAKFTSAFALGSRLLRHLNTEKNSVLVNRAHSAFQFGSAKPGYCQTAPCRAPYYYEEQNWVDDMELAAIELYVLTGDEQYLKKAIAYAQIEPVTPWMGADSARHYQWYPFMNMGHYRMAQNLPSGDRTEFLEYYREGILRIAERADNCFLMGVPFIWCSNNLVTAIATQCFLYRKLSNDSTFIRLENAMVDWLFGCNPWGVSMVIGYPAHGITARDPHSALSHHHGFEINGGLLDGPVYGSIYKNLKYLHLTREDPYKVFQSDLAVYHDDVGDYSTNEPTMDGTASLVYLMSSVEDEAFRTNEDFSHSHGAVIRGYKNRKNIALIFSGDTFGDGLPTIRTALKEAGITASFFLTGNFYRNSVFQSEIIKLARDGHYLGPHSDKHLLYCDWSDREKVLIDKKEFLNDLQMNYEAMANLGISLSGARYFLPPFEWYNSLISKWTDEFGAILINYTPGTLSHADYTIPDMDDRFFDNDSIFASIIRFEKENTHGLNGFILLSHVGADPTRKNKFYNNLASLIKYLQHKGYNFLRIDQLLNSG